MVLWQLHSSHHTFFSWITFMMTVNVSRLSETVPVDIDLEILSLDFDALSDANPFSPSSTWRNAFPRRPFAWRPQHHHHRLHREYLYPLVVVFIYFSLVASPSNLDVSWPSTIWICGHKPFEWSLYSGGSPIYSETRRLFSYPLLINYNRLLLVFICYYCRMSKRGSLIIFEGVDRCGKTTQVKIKLQLK